MGTDVKGSERKPVPNLPGFEVSRDGHLYRIEGHRAVRVPQSATGVAVAVVGTTSTAVRPAQVAAELFAAPEQPRQRRARPATDE